MTDYYYRRGDSTYTVSLDRQGSSFTADLAGDRYQGSWQELRPGYYQLELPDRSYRCFVAAEEDARYLFHEGAVYSLTRFDPRQEARSRRRSGRGLGGGGVGGSGGAGAGGGADHLCPLAGKVLKHLVEPGDVVEAGQPLLIVEAMKMEHTIKAQAAGTVTKFNFEPPQTVEAGARLLEFELAGDGELEDESELEGEDELEGDSELAGDGELEDESELEGEDDLEGDSEPVSGKTTGNDNSQGGD